MKNASFGADVGTASSWLDGMLDDLDSVCEEETVELMQLPGDDRDAEVGGKF